MSTGSYLVIAHVAGAFRALEYDGTPAGIASAAAACGANGKVWVFPSSGGTPTLPTLGAGVSLDLTDQGVTRTYTRSTALFTGALRDPVVNVKDFATFQAAHDYLPSTGGTIYVPDGYYNSGTIPAFGSASTPGMRITKQYVTVVGGGQLISYVRQSASKDQHAFDVQANNCTIRGLYISGFGNPGGGGGVGCGINWFKSGADGHDLVLDDLYMEEHPFWCIYIPTESGHFYSKVVMNRVATGAVYQNASGNGGGLKIGGVGTCDNYLMLKCEFASPGRGTHGTLPVGLGGVHVERSTNIRFVASSFQGPCESPVLSLLNTNAVQLLGGCYIERPAGTPVHAITTSAAINLLNIDSMYYQQGSSALTGGAGVMLLKSDSAAGGLRSCSIRNVILGTPENPPAGTNIISLNNASDELHLDNVFQWSTASGATYPFNVAGAGAVLKTIASATTVTLPSTEPGVYFISGTTAITSITAQRPGRRVTLIFTGALTFTDGSNLKLAGNYGTSSDDSITLICDGTNWFEICRSGAV